MVIKKITLASQETQPLSQPPTPLAPAILNQYAETLRGMIRHEDDVLDQRITWLCQVQGLLFAALAFVWKEPTANSLILLLCVVGMVAAITAWIALRPILQSVTTLRDWWEKVSANYSGPPIYVRARWGSRREGPWWNLVSRVTVHITL